MLNGWSSMGAAAMAGVLSMAAVPAALPAPIFANAASGPLGNTGMSTGVAWGDYDRDGDLDLYFANFLSANKLLRNDGATWTDATSAPLGDAGKGFGVSWGDCDNDGDLDLYLAN